MPELTNLPLTSGQKQLPSGALLPSGEANFFDFSQSHENNSGSGINSLYPNPSGGIFTEEYWNISGIYKTYPENSGLTVVDTSGIFHYNGLSGVFSNGPQTRSSGINDFVIFNPYIHYYSQVGVAPTFASAAIKIPFVSDYRIAYTFNPYSLLPSG